MDFATLARIDTDSPVTPRAIDRRNRRQSNATTATTTMAAPLPNCISTHTADTARPAGCLTAWNTLRSQRGRPSWATTGDHEHGEAANEEQQLCA